MFQEERAMCCWSKIYNDDSNWRQIQRGSDRVWCKGRSVEVELAVKQMWYASLAVWFRKKRRNAREKKLA